MKNFRTYQLALSLYQECQRIKIKNAVIRNQFERASLSIVLNLAEGSGRLSVNDKKRFYAIALGSLKETQCLLLLLNEQGLLTQSNHLNAMLINLIKSPGSFNPD